MCSDNSHYNKSPKQKRKKSIKYNHNAVKSMSSIPSDNTNINSDNDIGTLDYNVASCPQIIYGNKNNYNIS